MVGRAFVVFGEIGIDATQTSRTATTSFDVIGAADDAAWTAALERVAQHDFHHLAGYHRLAEYRGEGTAHLFAYRDGDHVIALPLLLRPIDASDPDGAQDATSVYGYAGPVRSDPPIPGAVVAAFQAQLRDEMERRRIVSVFSRLHPLIEQHELLTGIGSVRRSGQTVSVDLTIPPADQWAGYRKVTRRLIRRGLEAGVDCIHDRELVHLDDWVAIYAETMERVGAADTYRFDAAYFARMVQEVGSALHLFMAYVDGRPAAGGLFTSWDGIVEAHLGGSREEFSAFSPTRVIDDAARRWAAASGATVYHLGGGVGGQQDSLFRYKASFSDRRHGFSTWQWIVDEVAYERLSRDRGSARAHSNGGNGSTGYFPAYREPIHPGARPGA